jgi:pimeloyl-ACP methyl ester carboxylesterase
VTETADPQLAPAVTPVATELGQAVTAALADPPAPELDLIEANGIAYGTRAWGPRSRPPVLLIHGVTASSAIWWRVGPALAAALDRRIVAVDQAGHGRTGRWLGHHRFADNAADLVAFARAAGLAVPELRIVGHSWGGMTAAAMPAAGLVPERLVLLDAPCLPLAAIASRLDDPVERRYTTLGEAMARVGPAHPTWPWGDVMAKAEALTQLDEQGVIDVLTKNGDWDGGLAALADPAATDLPVWIIRADPAFGGLIPDADVLALEERVRAARLVTLRGTAHAPMRLHPEVATLALVRALSDG